MSTVLNLPDRSTPRGTVAAGVRARLAVAGITPARAADLVGMSQSAMSRRTTGAHPFDVDELGKIAELLGIEVGVFFQPLDYGADGSARKSRVRSILSAPSVLRRS